MSSPYITYTPRSDATHEAEISTLANVYRFVLDSANKNAAGVSRTNGDDDEGGFKNDSIAKQNFTS
jgi:hypothetical protein